jgi:hypothetical protein
MCGVPPPQNAAFRGNCATICLGADEMRVLSLHQSVVCSPADANAAVHYALPCSVHCTSYTPLYPLLNSYTVEFVACLKLAGPGQGFTGDEAVGAGLLCRIEPCCVCAARAWGRVVLQRDSLCTLYPELRHASPMLN